MISKTAQGKINQGSAVRLMFEEGKILRKKLGADKVYDFSLGNPDQEPPEAIKESLLSLARSKEKGLHAYMSNQGYPDLREKIAHFESVRNIVPMDASCVTMTCGAAAGLNIVLHSLLDPGDEVLVLIPYFTEYPRYIEEAGGKAVLVRCDADFRPDLEDLKAKITPKTKALILNSPNNPSGVVYEAELLEKINAVLLAQEQTIYPISDEVYRELIYDGRAYPPLLSHMKNALIIYSWSKSYALPGERIGYVCYSSNIEDSANLSLALAYYNRVLGFVNAPAVWQHVLEDNIGLAVDPTPYKKRRDRIVDIFQSLGLTAHPSEGTFYILLRRPDRLSTDQFVDLCKKHGVLFVSAKGFGLEDYVRVSYAVPDRTIEGMAEAMVQVMAEIAETVF